MKTIEFFERRSHKISKKVDFYLFLPYPFIY